MATEPAEGYWKEAAPLSDSELSAMNRLVSGELQDQASPKDSCKTPRGDTLGVGIRRTVFEVNGQGGSAPAKGVGITDTPAAPHSCPAGKR